MFDGTFRDGTSFNSVLTIVAVFSVLVPHGIYYHLIFVGLDITILLR